MVGTLLMQHHLLFEQLMCGASQVKYMAVGSVALQYVDIDVTEGSVLKIKEAMIVTEKWDTYVTVHAYTTRSVKNNPEILTVRRKNILWRILRSCMGFLVVIASFMLNGCVAEQAPAFSLLGSYFPSWMACALIGIVAAVIMRIVFIYTGIDEVLSGRLFVYVCLALAVAFISSLLLFAR